LGGIISRLWICFLFFASTLGAIDLNLPADAEVLASANTSILSSNPSASFHLPSLGTSGYETSIIYLYSEKELPLYSVFSGFHMLGGVLSTGAQVLSHPLYREENVMLNYHRKADILSFGFNERYVGASVENGEKSSAMVTDMGFGITSKSIETAFAIHNVFHASYRGDALPQPFLAELAYRPVEGTAIALGCEKEKGYDACMKISSQYDLSHALRIIAGYQHEPDRFSAGLEFRCRSWFICYAMQTHPDLDLTHAISLSWIPSE